jgi:hypothetical protein
MSLLLVFVLCDALERCLPMPPQHVLAADCETAGLAALPWLVVPPGWRVRGYLCARVEERGA